MDPAKDAQGVSFKILSSIGLPAELLQAGKTKAFMKTEAYFKLIDASDKAIAKYGLIVLKCMRGYAMRASFLRKRKAAKICQKSKNFLFFFFFLQAAIMISPTLIVHYHISTYWKCGC